jgi:hypothetical protein
LVSGELEYVLDLDSKVSDEETRWDLVATLYRHIRDWCGRGYASREVDDLEKGTQSY